MKFLVIASLVFAHLLVHQAFGQEVIYKKKESHKFSGLKLKGQFKKPELSYIYQRKGIKSEQIVDVPENFNQQIRDGAQKF